MYGLSHGRIYVIYVQFYSFRQFWQKWQIMELTFIHLPGPAAVSEATQTAVGWLDG